MIRTVFNDTYPTHHIQQKLTFPAVLKHFRSRCLPATSPFAGKTLPKTTHRDTAPVNVFSLGFICDTGWVPPSTASRGLRLW